LSPAADELRRLIHREGPLPFDRLVEVALYDPAGGFFARGRGAGRSGGDFITSPQVGSLFGALVARALDGWWRDLGAPDPFVVVEAGAGDGRLARDVQRAEPQCAPALRYVLVERSPALRDAQRERLPIEPADEALGAFHHEVGEDRPVPAAGTGPVFAALDDLPAAPFDGVLLANELLDNLPFGVAQWNGQRWDEVLVAARADGDGFTEVLVPARDDDDRHLRDLTAGVTLPAGARLPIPRGIDDWFRRAAGSLRRGVCCLIDYATPVAHTVARGSEHGWLRTYAAHGRGTSPLEHVGDQDITADVVVEHLLHAAARNGFALVAPPQSQAEWLRGLGLDDLVAEGRAAWDAGAARGDLAAIAGRSRATEGAALTDPAGLGAH
jgi:SAM-dependent MidA family methyltransferase